MESDRMLVEKVSWICDFFILFLCFSPTLQITFMSPDVIDADVYASHRSSFQLISFHLSSSHLTSSHRPSSQLVSVHLVLACILNNDNIKYMYQDGEWEAPTVPNPVCAAVGCGVWKRPTKKNAAYKGKWVAPQIRNDQYKGIQHRIDS